jgi:hypothetical protein
VEAWVHGACQWYHRLLSATGTTRDVAVVAEAQLLVMPETKREQSSPSGIADRCLVGRVGCSRIMHRARDVTSTGMVAHPDVDPGHVVGSEWWLGPAVGDVHGVHGVPQLQ